MSADISDRTKKFEIIAAIITGFGKIVFVDILDLKFYFIISTILFWCIYFFIRISKDRSLINYWGLSLSDARSTLRIILPVGLIALLIIILYAAYKGTLHLKQNIIFVLITYPFWGLVQQYLTMSLFAGNLKDYKHRHFSQVTIITATSLLFSMVHYPSWPLIAATFVMALFYSILFLRYRNIIPLGIFHGLLGGLFYYFILNRDPWEEFLKNIK